MSERPGAIVQVPRSADKNVKFLNDHYELMAEQGRRYGRRTSRNISGLSFATHTSEHGGLTV